MRYMWGNSRRFNAYSNYLKKRFGSRIQKVSIDAGFTCPNRDDRVGTGGCTFCSNDAFNPSYCVAEKPVEQQITEGIEFHENRYKRAAKYLAYFQAYSNTYADLDELKHLYGQALENDKIAGLVIGTRPDCVDEYKLDYFRELAEHYYIIVEYGIESCYNKTLERINRGHSFEKAVEAVQQTVDRGLMTGAHFIFGLPGETNEEMLATAGIISQLPLDSVKFHQLQIFNDTAIAEEYKHFPERFRLFDVEEYIDFIVNYLERLNPAIMVERIASESPPRFNVNTVWDLRYDQVLLKMEQKMEERDTWQGKLFHETN
jgi:uncharacterized protein